MVDQAITENVIRARTKLRRDTLVSVLDEFDANIMNLSPHKRAEKYSKMSQTAFSFFRGSAYLFYFDATRHYFPYHTPAERPTWIQGDLHFENFGAFRNESGDIVYDVNDFDEGYVGSYLYDILRMSVSIALVCRQLGYDTQQQLNMLEHYILSYYKQIRCYAEGKENPAKFIMDEGNAKGPVRKLLRKLEKRRQGHFLEKVTAVMQSDRVFLENSELVIPSAREQELLEQSWESYQQTLLCCEDDVNHYKIKDIAIKHGSGTASIGLDRYYVLIEGGATQEGEDDLILEVKEVRAPVPAYFLPYTESFWNTFGHQGKRVTTTQQAMHHKADPYLGYLTLDERDFYVRERSPYKKRLKLENIQSTDDMQKILSTMAKLTAKMHSRADQDVSEGILPYHSEREINKAMGSKPEPFVHHISRWAYAYTDQVERDYQLFCEWAASFSIQADDPAANEVEADR
ncbi:DUF2252 domain-containing protein [Paenibacillus wulumuqiensis]|uniref:DUF2252 domain-containing protein n=1 Tax=Paenibacillus wulumuqiensis TaxID=1567107 RepID=UPI00061934B9|nr:DUF2252 family protein [Paenibacillus wulumuqiensis]